MNILLTLLAGGFGAAVVKLLGDLIQHLIDRKEHNDDTEEARKKLCADAESARIGAVAEGVKWLLYDKIKYLGMRCLDDGSISFEDRQLLHRMHGVYHTGLGGNGDFDLLMSKVNELPQKTA